MELTEELSLALIRQHPERAAAAVESEDTTAGAELLAALDPRDAAALLRMLTTTPAARLVAAMDAETLVPIVEEMPTHVAARLLRSQDAAHRSEVFERLGPTLAQPLMSLLRYPERSAGGSMDPGVLEVRDNASVAQALERVRENPDRTRYNVYVVDAQHRLVGVINLRELLLASNEARVADLMVRDPHRIIASAGVSDVVQHPGWRVVHSLPVVDGEGVYLGAIRFRTLRRLEAELFRGMGRDADVADALGQLLNAGVGAVLSAMAPRRLDDQGAES